MAFNKLKKWTSNKIQNSSKASQYQSRKQEMQPSQFPTQVSGDLPIQMNPTSVRSLTSSTSSNSAPPVSHHDICKAKPHQLKIDTVHITPTASLRKLENFSEISLDWKTPARDCFPNDQISKRYKEFHKNFITDPDGLGEEEKGEDKIADDHNNLSTPAQPRPSELDNISPSNPDYENPASKSAFFRVTPRHNGAHNQDNSFAEFDLVNTPLELSAQNGSIIEDEEEITSLTARNRLPKKAGKMPLEMDKRDPENLSNPSILAHFGGNHGSINLAYLKSFNQEENDQLTASASSSTIRGPQSQTTHNSRLAMSSISDQIADAKETPLNCDNMNVHGKGREDEEEPFEHLAHRNVFIESRPPIPGKSSRHRRRQLAHDLSLDSPKSISELQTIKAQTSNDTASSDETHEEKENVEEKEDPFLHFACNKPTASKPRGSHQPSRSRPARIPCPPPKLHPRVAAAEARIAEYKASPEYDQRNKDLTFVNAHNKANRSAEVDIDNDEGIAVTMKPSKDDIAYNQAMERITEMSVKGDFRAMLKDMTFVRIYGDEMRVRTEQGIWWEGWMILDEMRKRGITSASEQD